MNALERVIRRIAQQRPQIPAPQQRPIVPPGPLPETPWEKKYETFYGISEGVVDAIRQSGFAQDRDWISWLIADLEAKLEVDLGPELPAWGAPPRPPMSGPVAPPMSAPGMPPAAPMPYGV